MRRMLVPFVLVVAACGQPAPTLTEQQTAAIADTMRQLADAYMADAKTMDFDRMMGHFGPEFVWSENGVLGVNRDSMVAAWRSSVATWRSVTRGAWTGTHVRVLGPDAAVVTAGYDWAVVDTAGASFAARGVWTAVYARTGAGWKIVHGHESYLPAAASR